MSEVSNFVPSKEQYDIFKDVLGNGIELIGLFYPKAAGAIASRRVDNLITVMKTVQRKLNEADIKPEERKAIALKLSVPFIEKASLEEDPSLQELWANLLVNALSPDNSEKVRSIFIDIIQNLSAFDVLILNAFHISRQPLISQPRNIVQIYTKEGYKSYPYEKVDASLSVLKALNLLTDVRLWEPGPFSNLEFAKFNGLNNVLQKEDLHLTPLGILFIDACVKDASK